MKLTFYGMTAVLTAAASVAGISPHVATLSDQLHGSDFPAALLALLALIHYGLSATFLVLVSMGLVHGRRIVPLLASAGLVTLVAQPAMGHEIDGLRLPDRPMTTVNGVRVVVQPGDTLWAIAGADRSDASAIVRAVEEWHRGNRDVIGDDPDLLIPGQVLRAPR